MFRVTALSMLLVTCAGASSASETAGPADPAPANLELAAMRPSLHPVDDLVQEASLGTARTEPAAPTLAARIAMAPKLIAKVDIGDQTMKVIVEGEVRHTWKVSTGSKGYATPRGVWQPYRMHTMWRSRKYDNAPMPHSIFFTGGYAIHATPHIKRLGKPASHGCVRLHPDHARELFALTKQYGRAGMRVIVEN